MQTLTVDLGERSYPIHIGPHLLTQPSLVEGPLPGRNVLIVTNDTVAPLYLDAARKLFAGHALGEVILPDGEAFKTLEMADRVYTALLKQRMDRKTTLVALGGGVIGDLTGFVAATYQRGVSFLQIPTTLLAQVDSSVGGKTAVNHPLGKNMIGAFHQPLAVLADTATLDTLPDRELRAGLAEVIKYGLLADRPFLDWIETNLAALLRRDADALAHAIRRSCEIKAAIVAEDEREAGRRALLNLGHTFGHAIETAAGYGNWLHGEAVATGMLMAADLSKRLGWISEADLARVERLLVDAGLPVVPPPIAPERFMDLMAVDKKNVDGQLRLVLMRALGEAVLTAEADPALLQATLEHYHDKAA